MEPKAWIREAWRAEYWASLEGAGEKARKKMVLLLAMLAWLKREAVAGLRAYCRVSCFIEAFSASKPSCSLIS